MKTDQGDTRKENRKTGSPQNGEPLCIAVGKIRKPHGVKGEVLFEAFQEYAFSLKKGDILLIGKDKEAYTIRTIRQNDQLFLVAFDGLEDCESVGHLRNQLVYLRADQLTPLEGGHLYPHEVLGMSVVDETGNALGVLSEVLITGANDVYVIKKDDEDELLLPAIDSVILSVDPTKKVLRVKLPVWD